MCGISKIWLVIIMLCNPNAFGVSINYKYYLIILSNGIRRAAIYSANFRKRSVALFIYKAYF